MQAKIRVGFVLNPRGASWVGGDNYIMNLLRAIRTCTSIEPVVFSGSRPLLNDLAKISDIESHVTSLVTPKVTIFLREGILCVD